METREGFKGVIVTRDRMQLAPMALPGQATSIWCLRRRVQFSYVAAQIQEHVGGGHKSQIPSYVLKDANLLHSHARVVRCSVSLKACARIAFPYRLAILPGFGISGISRLLHAARGRSTKAVVKISSKLSMLGGSKNGHL